MFDQDLFIGAVYLAGVLSFFSPCVFPLLPVYFGILSNGGKRSLLKTFVFILGLSTSFVILGFGAGSLGSFFQSDIFRIISGIIVILFGIVQMGVLKIPILERTKLLEVEGKGSNSIWGAYLLGFTFSLGWTPCIGPILASILFISSGGGDPRYGALMMLIYVIGLATPFLIFSFFYKQLEAKMGFVKKYLLEFKKIGGLLLIFMGILLLTDRLNIFL